MHCHPIKSHDLVLGVLLSYISFNKTKFQKRNIQYDYETEMYHSVLISIVLFLVCCKFFRFFLCDLFNLYLNFYEIFIKELTC